MTNIYEKLTGWYLRFNGYFIVENFVVHAADDVARISDGVIAPYTEVDSIAIRMPYSAEKAGKVMIANHDVLVENQNARFDIVIAEAKSGKDNKPNSVWRNKVVEVIKYIVRFVGLYDEDQIEAIANELSAHYFYEDKNSRIRYIIFANEPNPHYSAAGIKYITFSQIAEFLTRVRGQSWTAAGIGVASVHYQWDKQINQIFEIMNSDGKSLEVQQSEIMEFLASENKKTG